VITTNLEHNSVIRPVNHMVRDQGVEATFLPFNGAGFVEPGQVEAAMRPNTRAVIVNHGSNVIGTVQPVGEIGRICRERGATFVVDTAQTAGVVPIDMKAMNIDVVAFTGHKALMGCMGIGGLCIRKHVTVRQVRSGGTGVNSEYPYQPEEYPWRLECGTPNLVGVASLWAGQEWLDEQGLARIHEREMKLAARLVAGLRQIEGVRLYCCDNLEHHIPTILMNLEGVDPGNVGTLLDVDHEIAVRTGLHCAPLVHRQLGLVAAHGGVRFSIGAFNTMEQVETAIAAISDISRWARERGTGKLAAGAVAGK
jgi:selenocysteine lyase/cysteine desulfurase